MLGVIRWALRWLSSGAAIVAADYVVEADVEVRFLASGDVEMRFTTSADVDVEL